MVKYELSAAIGTYQKDGQEKTRWAKIGTVMETKSGKLAMKIDTIPVNWDGWASLMEPRPKDDKNDIPF